jgi:predicted acyltransferase
MCGMALVIFTDCYYLVDIKKVSWWTKPFVIFGVKFNSITIWMGEWMLYSILNRIKLHQPGGADVSVWALIYSRLFASWAGRCTARN